MTETTFTAIVLAAGKGTRMKSRTPKVLHTVAGLSMVGHVLRVLGEANAQEVILVTSPDQDEVREAVCNMPGNIRSAVQHQQLGTADAVKSARDAISSRQSPVIVLCGDAPLIRPDTIAAAVTHARASADVTVLGFRAADPTGYGRLLLDDQGSLKAIREEADASAEERAVDLCNSGVIAFARADHLDLLDRIGNDNAKGEYYLTDIIEVAAGEGLSAGVVECPEEETLGVNSRAQLAQAEAVLQDRLRLEAMEGGATLTAPETVYMSADTKIGSDVTIEPHVFIGPGVTIADGAVIHAFSHLEQTEVGEGANVGPYARLRPGARLGQGAKVGNFVEIKKAEIEAGAKVNHLTYIGDARVGKGANVGAGTITCNYDGYAKHFTDIGDGAFIGSNSSLVAPVSVGDGAYVGSGSVITKSVAADALAVTRAQQIQKDQWAERNRKIRSKQKSRKQDASNKQASGG